MSGIQITGQVLSVTHMQKDTPTVNDRTGEVERGPYNQDRIRLLIEDDILDVKADNLADAPVVWDGALPEKGQTVTLDVSFVLWKDRTSGRPMISWRGHRVAAGRPAAVRSAS